MSRPLMHHSASPTVLNCRFTAETGVRIPSGLPIITLGYDCHRLFFPRVFFPFLTRFPVRSYDFSARSNYTSHPESGT